MKPKDIVFKLKGFTAATFSHDVHTAAYSCKDCHTKMFPYKAVVGKASMGDMAKGKSCGSCHKQALAFADNVSFSTGFSDRKTSRNSMSILNPVNNNNMFWDSRAKSPLELSLMPVFNHLEMGMETDAQMVANRNNH